MAYSVMTCVGMAELYSYGLYSYGLYRYGLYSNCRHSVGAEQLCRAARCKIMGSIDIALYGHGLYSYGLCRYGRYSVGAEQLCQAAG